MHRTATTAAALLFLAFMPLDAHAAPTVRALDIAVQRPEGDFANTTVNVPLVLAFASNNTVSGDYQTFDGTATVADNDYLPASGKFTIPPGQLSTFIPITIVGDARPEPNETFTLVISNVQNANPTDLGPFIFTIVNDDIAVQVVDVALPEGNAGLKPMIFTVSLPAPVGVEKQATFRTTDGTAVAGQDYEATTGRLTFAPGEVSKTVTVNVIGDTNFEPNETFTLSVTPIPDAIPTASAAGPTVTVTGTILNDDTPKVSAVRVISGSGQNGLLGQTLPQPLVVEVVAEDGSFAAGQTVVWRVTRGSAQVNPATSVTNAQGRAQTTVTLTGVGPVEVQATVGQLPPVLFTLASATLFGDRAQGPVAVPIARVLDQICARNEDNFNTVCAALSRLSNEQLTSALERVAPQGSGAQAKVATEVVSIVTSGIGARLAAMRSGERFSASRVSLDYKGRPVPIAAISTVLRPLLSAKADDDQADAPPEEDIYNGWSAYLSGDLGSGKRIARDGQLGFDLKTRGVMAGADRLVGNTTFGASVNLMQLDSDLSDAAGSLDTTGYALSLYAARVALLERGAPAADARLHYDGVHVAGSLTLGRNRYEAEHRVFIPGDREDRATSENDANVFAVSGVTGIDAHRGKTEVGVTLGGTWSRAQIDDLTEEGGGPLILFVQGQDIDSLTANLGLDARTTWQVPRGVLHIIHPTLRAELNHEFKSGARLVTARFLRDRLGTSFTVPMDRPDSNYGRLSAGLDFSFEHGFLARIAVTQDVLRSDLHFRTAQLTVSKSF
ncbi:MAG TPA: autotransporter domain-containing protein [Thermoanaerobaculia bacterium]|nr:autotransporter domain-containing protein [Thermoanaerobaculia bacterium]